MKIEILSLFVAMLAITVPLFIHRETLKSQERENLRKDRLEMLKKVRELRHLIFAMPKDFGKDIRALFIIVKKDINFYFRIDETLLEDTWKTIPILSVHSGSVQMAADKSKKCQRCVDQFEIYIVKIKEEMESQLKLK